MNIKCDPEIDLDIDVDNLQDEFRRIGPLIYAYSETRARANEAFGLAKAELEELRSQKYLEIRAREGKITEATIQAEIDTDSEVKKAVRKSLEAKKDYETVDGFVDGLHANKDALIQLGADSRKER